MSLRQVVLDTETTGLSAEDGHRIVEIGCVEIVDRRLTGRTLHLYVNPERDIDPGALEVHGLTRERLSTEPRFAELADRVAEFVADAELLIHNAPFDMGFLEAEFRRIGRPGFARAPRAPVVRHGPDPHDDAGASVGSAGSALRVFRNRARAIGESIRMLGRAAGRDGIVAWTLVVPDGPDVDRLAATARATAHHDRGLVVLVGAPR